MIPFDPVALRNIVGRLDDIQPVTTSPFHRNHVEYTNALEWRVAATVATLPHLRAAAPTILRSYTEVHCARAGAAWQELEHDTQLRTGHQSLDALVLGLCPKEKDATDELTAARTEWVSTLYVCGNGWVETCLKR